MLTTNTIRYGTDGFSFDKSGQVKPNTPWDFTEVSSVDGFTITGTQPPDTDRRAVFQVDGGIYKLSISGGVATQESASGDTDSILADGNTMTELASVTSIPEWVGKEVTPIFALYAGADVAEANFPTLGVTAKYTSNADQYVKTEYSPEIELPSGSTIVDTTVNSTATTGNSVDVRASLYNDGAWSEYTPLSQIVNLPAEKIKLRAVYTMQTIGVGSAVLRSVKISTRKADAKTSSIDSVIITKTRDLGMAAKYIRTSIVHDKLKDAEIECFATFRSAPQSRTLYPLGTSTGVVQTFTLPDEDIVPSSIVVTVGNAKALSFDYNLEVHQLTLKAEAGKSVFVSYDYGAGVEEWQPMTAVGTQEYELDKTKYNSSFSYTLPANEVGKEIAAVKYYLAQNPGTATENLGTATGKTQKFVLQHEVKDDTLAFSNQAVSFSYSEEDGIVTLTAPAGTPLVATYDYNGVPPVVYNYVVAWND